MAKLYFRFGAMGSSKTAQALMTKFNYEEKGRRVWLIKPAIDTRDDKMIDGVKKTFITSRIGLSAEAQVMETTDNIITVMRATPFFCDIGAVICDECQFLTEAQVDQLKQISEEYDIPVLCFGLRSDFQTHLFPGSKRLFEIADSISEIKSICQCGRKATVNARIDVNGNIITDGNQIDIGGNEKYESMCWFCYQKKHKRRRNRP